MTPPGSLRATQRRQLVSTGYNPRPWQNLVHRSLKRWNCLVLHRRAGKTTLIVNEMIDQGLRNSLKNPVYAYVAPTYGQAKRIAWIMFKEATKHIPGVEVNEAELRIDIKREANGDHIRFMLLGAENPSSLKGIYLDGVALDEYGSMSPVTWTEAIRPTLIDRNGWAIFCGTPVGQNHFAEMYDQAMADSEWFAYKLRASESGIIPQAELDSLRKEMDESEYEQELEVSFLAGLIGAYWGKEMEAAEKDGRLTRVPYDPMLQVHTFWDLGLDDVTAIWFMQRHFAQWRAIDYMQAPDVGLDEWAVEVKRKKYHYGNHYFPHDIKARELVSGKMRLDAVWAAFGKRSVIVVPKVQHKPDSIAAGRRMIPKTVFDAEKCKDGIKALRNYQRKWDSQLGAFSPKPLHNFASNGADAWQQFAMGSEEDRGDIDLTRISREYDSSPGFGHMGAY